MNSCSETCGLSRSTTACCGPQCTYWHVWKYHLSATDKYLQWDVTVKLPLKKDATEQNSSLEFVLSLCPSWTLQLFAPWPPMGFSIATALCSAPCLCSHFSFISREAFFTKGSSEWLGLMLGSGDVARLWAWGPGLKVHHALQWRISHLLSRWARSCSCSGETH